MMVGFKNILKITVCLITLFSIISPAFAVYDEIQINQEVTEICNYNGVCEASETYSNCPNDCPAPAPGPTPIYDLIPPVIYNLLISRITLNSATIQWDTNEQAICKIFWGQTLDYEKGSISESAYSRNHSVELANLLSNTIYYFKISCQDTSKNEAETIGQKFSTLALPDTTAPVNVSDFEAEPGNEQIKLKWENPRDEDFKGVRILRSDRFFPIDPWDGALIYDGRAEEFVDTGLENKKRYYYTAFAYDKAGNFSSGAVVSAIPRAKPPEEGEPIEIFPPEIPEAPEIPPELKDILDRLSLEDFEFWQENRQLPMIKGKVAAKPESPLTVLIKYEKLPEVLKTMMMTLLRADGKAFSFLLKINKDKSAYMATILPPDPEKYPMTIQVLDYKKQRVKKLEGELEIEKLPAQATSEPFWIRFKLYIIWGISLLGLLLIILFYVYKKIQEQRERKTLEKENF